LPGTYTEPVIVYTQFIDIVARVNNPITRSNPSEATVILSEDFDEEHKNWPAMFITNGTKEEAVDFLSGKADHYHDFDESMPENGLEYVGPSTLNKDVSYDPLWPGANASWGYDARVRIIGVDLFGNNTSGSEGLLVISMSPDEEVWWIRSIQCVDNVISKMHVRYLFNLQVVEIEGLLMDNSGGLTINRPERLEGGPQSGIDDYAVFQGSITGPDYIFKPGIDPLFRNGLYILGDTRISHDDRVKTSLLDEGLSSILYLDTEGGDVEEESTSAEQIKFGEIVLKGGAGLKTHLLHTKNVEMDTSGSLRVGHLEVLENVQTDGGTFIAKGGTIEGDLTVNSPGTADLTNVVVKGDISGDGTIVQNGGGYLGDNTASDYTHNELKTE